MWIATEMTLRDLLRRRGVLLLLFVIPLVFYQAMRLDRPDQAVRMVALGVAFTVSTAALFSTGGARLLEPRLRLSGYRIPELYGGRMLAIFLVGLLVAVPYVGIVVIDQDVERMGAVALMFLCAVMVATPFGMLLGTVMPRELEGTLLLLALIGAQMITNPAGMTAKFMPFWSVREITTYVVEATGADYLSRGVLHAAGYAAGVFLLTALFARLRAREGRLNRRTARA